VDRARDLLDGRLDRLLFDAQVPDVELGLVEDLPGHHPRVVLVPGEQRPEDVAQFGPLVGVLHPGARDVLRGREEDEDVVEIVLLGEIEGGVEVGVNRLVQAGRRAGVVALDLPGVALEGPPANDVDAGRLRGGESVA
jgi:hypothetical protein